MPLENRLDALQINLFAPGELPPPLDQKSTSPPQSQQVKELALDKILSNHWQPRIYFDQESITELANDIKQNGLLQPILVRKSPKAKGQYELIAGERRFRAYKPYPYT